MTIDEFAVKCNPCAGAVGWGLKNCTDMADVWHKLCAGEGRSEWLMWLVSRACVIDERTARKLACRFVRETPLADGRTVWDLLTDPRSRHAVETAERFADGLATPAELDAARDAWTAVDAAVDAAGDAARDAARATVAAAGDAAIAAYAAIAARNAAWAAGADGASWDAAGAAVAAAWDAQRRIIAEIPNPFEVAP